jgi:hypothetical protein
MQIADRQNWSLGEAKSKVSSSELIMWKVYLERDINTFHREDYYYAQIALEVRRVLAKNPNKIKLEQFLLRFSLKNAKKKITAESVETRTLRSKAFWLGFVGAQGPIKRVGWETPNDG